jgi:hypothetical protein
MARRKAAPKFGVDDTVRFIGTDTALTIRQIDQETLEYEVQWGDDAASLEWASEIYFELVDRPTSDDDAS